jgi:GAF domain-containing protein
MLNAIRNFFSPPVFENEDKSRSARILNIILWASIFLLLISRIISIKDNQNWAQRLINPVSILIGIMVMLVFVVKLGYIRQTSFILLAATWAALSFQAYTSNGIYDVAYVGTVILILLAGLLLDFKYSIVFAFLTILTGWGLGYYQTISGISVKHDAPLSIARDYTIVFTLITLVTYLIISGLRNAVTTARENEQKQIKTNLELRELQTSLEERVAARTNDLEASKLLSEKYTKSLEAVAEISHSMASIQEIDELLPTIVHLISERYRFYHVGIYLIDEAGEYAVLSAASSEGGQHMLESQQKLRVEPSSLVGFAASRGRSRVASNVDQDTSYLAVSDLPDTKSEAVFPLQAGVQIIGVLDVQSAQPDAFTGDEVNILNTLANQVAISIQNVRSFGETRRALAESERIYQQFVQQGWGRIVKGKPVLGYKYSQDGLNPVETASTTEPVRPNTKSPSANQQDQSDTLSIPIKLRDQTIGTMRVHSTRPLREWDQDELAMVQATAERAALALENARLLEDSQHRAAKERLIGEISSKISASVDLDNIMQTAAKELGLAISDSEVVVRFQAQESEQQKEQDHVE